MPESPQEQSHPLHATDRLVIDGLLAAQTPADLERVLRLWQLDRHTLQQRTRAIWAAGFRPGPPAAAEAVGSGFDTAGEESP